MEKYFFYRRNLPHFQSEFSYYFITFRLLSSMPNTVIEKLKTEFLRNKKLILNNPDKKNIPKELYKLQKRYFGIFDNYLDTNKECINYLSDPKIAGIVDEAIKYRDGKVYELICFCIMPNHVHKLIYVQRFDKPLYKIMQSLKRHTSRESNKIINRTGSFWHEESYDHIVRNKQEYFNIINYIMSNPVKAGLVKSIADWKWSYCKYIQ